MTRDRGPLSLVIISQVYIMSTSRKDEKEKKTERQLNKELADNYEKQGKKKAAEHMRKKNKNK